MNHHNFKKIFVGISFLIVGCGHDRSEGVTATLPKKNPQSKSIGSADGGVSALGNYTWTTAPGGLGCLPRLVEMMQWYSADSLHTFRFIRYSINTEKAQGYYLLNDKEANRYLAALRRSGYFSEHYLEVEKKSFQVMRSDFLKAKQTDGEPEGLESDRIFPVTSFEDMMELKDKFSFSAENGGRTIRFDTGEAVQLVRFNSKCQIERLDWVSRSAQTN